MRASLITRDGCHRLLEVTYPPPPEILLPLRKDHDHYAAMTDAPANPDRVTPTDPVAARKYLLVPLGLSPSYGPTDTAMYEEA